MSVEDPTKSNDCFFMMKMAKNYEEAVRKREEKFAISKTILRKVLRFLERNAEHGISDNGCAGRLYFCLSGCLCEEFPGTTITNDDAKRVIDSLQSEYGVISYIEHTHTQRCECFPSDEGCLNFIVVDTTMWLKR